MVALRAGERILRQELATLELPGGVGERDGTLFLTDQRVLLEGLLESGSLDEAMVLAFWEARLAELTAIEAPPPERGPPRLRLATARGAVEFRVVAPEAWRVAVDEARRRRGLPVSAPKDL